MPAPVTLRTDFSASELRRLAKGSKNAKGGFCRLRQPVPGLALQLHLFSISESMGHHDSEIMDDRGIDRGDA
jgi:hypothetical protein